MTYQLELVWNREFTFRRFGSTFENLDVAIAFAQHVEYRGDGCSVKKTRIVDSDDVVVWQYGKKTLAYYSSLPLAARESEPIARDSFENP